MKRALLIIATLSLMMPMPSTAQDPRTAAQHLKLGQELAQKNQFDDAIIQFQRSLQKSKTACDRGFAQACITAAQAAKDKLRELGADNPHVGQAFDVYWSVYQTEEKKLPDDCFI